MEGLLAQAIARNEQCVRAAVPDGKREHAAQPLDRSNPPLTIGGEQDFSVGSRPEVVAALGQIGAQLEIVVDLAVEADREVAVRSTHRLSTSVAQIVDSEAAVA